MPRSRRLLLTAVVLSLLSGWLAAPGPVGAQTAPPPVLVAAGDIACDPNSAYFNGGAGTGARCEQADTARLVASQTPTAVVTLGDNQYEDGRLSAFRASYDPTWGAFLTKTRPAVGNHEYRVAGAAGYFDYFGTRAGSRTGSRAGTYAFNVGSWRVYVMNSNCAVVSCARSGAQVQWLLADMAANPRRCTVMAMHHPRWSTGQHGNTDAVAPLVQAFYERHGDVMLAGHDHDAQRWKKSRPDATPDATTGIRSWVIGTGGKDTRPFARDSARIAWRKTGVHGVLRLRLGPDSAGDGDYTWAYKQLGGATGTTVDSGTGSCRA